MSRKEKGKKDLRSPLCLLRVDHNLVKCIVAKIDTLRRKDYDQTKKKKKKKTAHLSTISTEFLCRNCA